MTGAKSRAFARAGSVDRSMPVSMNSASLSISAGVNVLALQRMLGHTSAKVALDSYADLFDDDLDAVAVTLHARYSHGSVLKVCSPEAQDNC
jgi:hypothetical protein